MACLIDKFSKEELQKIVNNSFCLRDVVKAIGYSSVSGSNNETVRKRLKKLNISTEHFTHQLPETRTMNNVFCIESTASQATVRRWYLKISDNSYCEICKCKNTWNDKPLTMILDHKNGDNHDNRIGNLRWICPNCDSQLPTYAGRNLKASKTRNIANSQSSNNAA
jgi:hypothetical protein